MKLNLTGAQTGRLDCSKIHLSNTPKAAGMNFDEIKKATTQSLEIIEQARQEKLKELGETLRTTMVIPLCKKYGMTYKSGPPRGFRINTGNALLYTHDTSNLEIQEAFRVLNQDVGSDALRIAHFVRDVTKEDLAEETFTVHIRRFGSEAIYKPFTFTTVQNNLFAKLIEELSLDEIDGEEDLLIQLRSGKPVYVWVNPYAEEIEGKEVMCWEMSEEVVELRRHEQEMDV